jgi:peptide/nickel transport system ATP-binding protein
MTEPLLSVRNLVTQVATPAGPKVLIDKLSFDLARGETLCIAGESGSGKSITALSLMGLLPTQARVVGGQALFKGRDLFTLGESQMRQVRGADIGMIFQEPMTSLNPVRTVGAQLIEAITAHQTMGKAEALAEARRLLAQVQISDADRRLKQYPHEFSGGMRQRIVIAISLLTSPALIIADEPTTALDVTIQAEIMDLLLELCRDEDMGLLLITHDLAVVSEVTQKIAVMYAGRIVEMGTTRDVVDRPEHPYTKGLIGALPQSCGKGQKLKQIPGIMPSLAKLPSGCSFHPRCELCQDICKREVPLPETKASGRQVACFMVK